MLPRAHVRAPWLRVALAQARATGRAIVDEVLTPLAGIGVCTLLVILAFALAKHTPHERTVVDCAEQNAPDRATVRLLADEYVHHDPRFERTLQDALDTYGADALECTLQRAEAQP